MKLPELKDSHRRAIALIEQYGRDRDVAKEGKDAEK